MPEAPAPALPFGAESLPAPEGVHCIRLPLARLEPLLDEAPSALLPDWLATAEQEQFARHLLRKRRLEWLGARLAAKLAWQASVRVNTPDQPAPCPRLAVVRKSERGRPELPGHAVSLSHCRSHAMAAVTAAAAAAVMPQPQAKPPLGVDIECFAATGAASLGELIGEHECERLGRALGRPPSQARTLLWCLKEALFKALGDGAFASFAQNLQLQAWRRDVQAPVWHCAPALSPLGPTLQRCEYRHGWRSDAAWALVSLGPGATAHLINARKESWTARPA